MKTSIQLKALPFLLCAFFISAFAFGQDKKAPLSPRDSVSGTVAGATITINYGAPSVRGRKIFSADGLQPYGKVWRAGANQMTTFKTSKDIMVEGKKLPAGKYSLFLTPGEKQWTVIFNSVNDKWGIKNDGSANDDPAKDVAVVTVNGKTAPMTERLVYKITSKGFSMIWENTEVPVRIK